MSGFTKNLSALIHSLKKKKTIQLKDIQEAIAKIKILLLEADVYYDIVEEFIHDLSEKLLKIELNQNIDISDLFYQHFRQLLLEYLGGGDQSFVPKVKRDRLETWIVVGLQGSGKTTSLLKIAHFYKDDAKILLVGADVHRKAARDQLKQKAEEYNIEFYTEDHEDVVKIIRNAQKYAKKNLFHLVLVDLAGRSQVDHELKNELTLVNKKINPQEIILVLDSSSGQIIYEVGKFFLDTLSITGLFLSKFDGDAKGGSLISVKKLLNCPVYFIGTGEKIEDCDVFYPDRVVARMIGEGDIKTLVEKSQKAIGQENIEDIEKRIQKGDIDFNILYMQFQSMKKMGGIHAIAKMIPGASQMEVGNQQEKMIDVVESLILSMTLEERKKIFLLNNPSRKKRVVLGSGRTQRDFAQMIGMLQKMKKMSKRMKGMKLNEVDLAQMSMKKN